MKIAIIGSGISSLGAAWLLHKEHDITVFEADERIGGHANTVHDPAHPPIDTGFIVYNDWTYPNLINLFDELGVDTEASDMSFGVSLDDGAYEYSSDHLFAQKKHLFSLTYWQMLYDLVRFYRHAGKLNSATDDISLNAYLATYGYSRAFIYNHILPMAAAIWSADTENIGEFPLSSFLNFFNNHGLLILDVNKRPQWRTVKGGSRNYVDKLVSGFRNNIRLNHTVHDIRRFEDYVLVEGEQYDHVIIGSHTDQAVQMLGDISNEEQLALGQISYKPNRAVLHTDPNLMPHNPKTWASWNFMRGSDGVYVTYWMNKLQPSLGTEQNYFVTINPPFSPAYIIYETDYAHPQFTTDSPKCWQELKNIQGQNRTWFCGAWCGYGFHEDGLGSGLAVGEALSGLKRPWTVEDKSPAGQNAGPVSD